jgi:polar amino acid transport system substrate-binding protein
MALNPGLTVIWGELYWLASPVELIQFLLGMVRKVVFMIKRFRHPFRVLVLGLLLAVTTVAAQTQPASLVMVTEVWPPFRMNDPQSPSGFSGIDIDLTLELSARIGIPIEIARVPWARALDMMRTGTADLITGVAWTEERARFMSYATTSYASVRPMFLATRGRGAAVQAYGDLQGKSIGLSTNSAYFPRFNDDNALNKIGLSTEVQILQMLAVGRIDLAIGTDPNLSYDLARLGLKDKVEPTAWQPDYQTALFVAASARSSAASLVGQIDQAIQSMLADGTMDRILKSYR